jgi:hypothetical protein
MRLMPAREEWLSLTPEPERDLPAAIATLRAGGSPAPERVESERARAERLVLSGNRQRWLSWLNEGLELAEDPRTEGEPELRAARDLLLDVIENHHALEQGLPGRARAPAGDREAELMRRVWARNGKEAPQ